jgi:3',5'-cyclic AMP phosphodiesterase CpdA
LPGNHDLGDNPTVIGPVPPHLATEPLRQNFIDVIGEDRWRFDEAGWCFIGLNSLIMNTGIESEAEQFDWLASELARVNGKPVALFIHKPLYLNTPDDPELESSAIRYVPQPRRKQLIEMFGKVDLGLVASGHVHQRRDFTFGHTRHVWAPSAGFIIPDRIQEVIGIKETGLVEYRFAPDSFEVRHIRAPGQIDIGLDELLGEKN